MGRIEGKLIVVFLAVMFTVAVMTMWPALIKEWGYTGRADGRVMGMETHVSTHGVCKKLLGILMRLWLSSHQIVAK